MKVHAGYALLSLINEPAKSSLNNAIDQGVYYYPLGMQQASETGKDTAAYGGARITRGWRFAALPLRFIRRKMAKEICARRHDYPFHSVGFASSISLCVDEAIKHSSRHMIAGGMSGTWVFNLLDGGGTVCRAIEVQFFAYWR